MPSDPAQPAAHGEGGGRAVLPRARRRLAAASVYMPLLPAVGVVAALTAFPYCLNLYLSFTHWRGGFDPPVLTGLANFRFLLTYPNFWNSAILSGLFTVAAVVFEVALGLGLALLLNRNLPGTPFFRTALIIPMVMTPAVSALTWKTLIYDANWGLLNYLVSLVGGGRHAWLAESHLAMATVIAMDVWHWTPFTTLVMLAGLASLPRELYEAAAIDRANAWQRLWHITLPLLAPVLLVATMFRTMDAFRTFDVIFIMTGGGPGRVTETLPLLIYQIVFSFSDFGAGAAVGMLMLLVAIGVVAAFSWALGRVRAATS